MKNNRWNIQNGILNRSAIIGAISGTILLVCLSCFQKIITGFNPYIWQAYIIPTIFGCCSGLIMGTYINKLRKAIYETKDTQKKLYAVLDGIDSNIYVVDFETHEILYMNKYMIDIFGSDFTDKTCYKVLRDETQPCADCKMNLLSASGNNSADGIIWEGTQKITGRANLYHARLMEWTDGRKAQLQIATDITQIKAMEKKQREYEIQLYQVQKMQAIGTLAGGIAHDFNNILSGIFGYAHLVKNYINDPEKVSKNIDNVIKGGQKAAALVQQILTVSRQSESQRKIISIGPVVKEALKLLQASLPSTIKIKHDISSKDTIMADPTKIHQIIMNLCTNAYHSMLDTGGTLTITIQEIDILDQGSIHRIDVPTGHYIKLEVSDTGHGIDSETLKKIFDPYFTTKPIGRGTGLGLAITAGIVEEHQGYLKVYSEPGQGTTFHIYFPIIKKESKTGVPKEKAASPKGGSETIMIVDDKEEILESISDNLKENGYKVYSYKNGSAAFEQYKKTPDEYDLIISDMTMPEMTGLELSKKVLELKPTQKIFICTGFSEAINQDEALSIGICRYLEKPLLVDNLLNEIRSVLDS